MKVNSFRFERRAETVSDASFAQFRNELQVTAGQLVIMHEHDHE